MCCLESYVRLGQKADLQQDADIESRTPSRPSSGLSATIAAANLAIWKQFPYAAFTLYNVGTTTQPGGEMEEEFRLVHSSYLPIPAIRERARNELQGGLLLAGSRFNARCRYHINERLLLRRRKVRLG
jgi:hypothetical protein